MPEPLFAVPHLIETERLVIRRYAADDAEQLHDLTTRNVDHLKRYMEWIKFEPQTVEQRGEFIERTHREFDSGEDYTMGMFRRDGTLLGGTGYHVMSEPDRLEIGYWIGQEYEGNGYVTEASAALVWVGLHLAGADIVDIAHAPSNDRSRAIAERLRLQLQEDRGHGGFDGGEMHSVMKWWATRETLATEPLASFPRPRAWDANGDEIAWPE